MGSACQNCGSFSETATALRTGEVAAGGETAPAELEVKLEPAELLFIAEASPGHQCHNLDLAKFKSTCLRKGARFL